MRELSLTLALPPSLMDTSLDTSDAGAWTGGGGCGAPSGIHAGGGLTTSNDGRAGTPSAISASSGYNTSSDVRAAPPAGMTERVGLLELLLALRIPLADP